MSLRVSPPEGSAYPSVELRDFDPQALDEAGLFPPAPGLMSEEQITFEFRGKTRPGELTEAIVGRRTLWNVHAAIADDMPPVGIVALQHILKDGGDFEQTWSSVYLLHPGEEVRRRRVATHAMHGLLYIAFDELNLPRVDATIAAYNVPSTQFHRRLGYIPSRMPQVETFEYGGTTLRQVVTYWSVHNPNAPREKMQPLMADTIQHSIKTYSKSRAGITFSKM